MNSSWKTQIDKTEYVLKKILFWGGIPGAFLGAYIWGSGFVADLHPVKPNDFSAAVIESLERTENCAFNESEWLTGYGELIKNEENDSYILASTTQSSLLQLKKSIRSKNEMELTFVPLSANESNVVVIAHELFEITIGDGSNRRVTVKAKLAGHKNMVPIPANNEGEKSFLLPEAFALGREATVRVIPKPNSQNEEELIVTVYYYPDEHSFDRKSVTKEYKFPIPEDFKGTNKPIRVSVGILNTENKEDLEARFKCFKISLADDDSTLSYVPKQQKVLE